MNLTNEQKEHIMMEIAHYLAMDCYDFAIRCEGLNILFGAFADAKEGGNHA